MIYDVSKIKLDGEVKMSKLEVLVTTMHQKDFSKYKEMNLQTDAVIANQADINSIEECNIDGARVKLVTTATRGLSKNRNIAIANISDDAEYIMFSDDDLKFYKNYEDIILEEFRNNPSADAIKFNINFSISQKRLTMKPITEFKRVNRKQVTSFGVWGLVIKRDVLIGKKLSYNERFGTGTPNYCGEDSIFLQEMFKKKIKFYVSPKYIADIDQSSSSWFEGYNEKNFTVRGKVINECYPVLSFVLLLRSSFKTYIRGQVDMSFFGILKCYYKGAVQNMIERRK